MSIFGSFIAQSMGFQTPSTAPHGNEFSSWIVGKLSATYMLNKEDVDWLVTASKFWDGKKTKASAQAAMVACVRSYGGNCPNIDPFELLIDANLMRP